MSTIAVCVRLRPLLPNERSQKQQPNRLTLQPETKQVNVELTDHREKNFKFDAVFGPETAQEDVHELLKTQNLAQRVAQGFHSTVFAYGQTGSGKTYTIQGGDSPETQGVAPRLIKDVFKALQNLAQGERGFRAYISFLQIYNEGIYDLIDTADGKPLKMRWNKHQQFTVQNLFEGQCRTAEEALRWWKRGQKHKILGVHKLNATSSRSHCLLTLRLQTFPLDDPSETVESKLQIVDLAGSERQKATRSTGVVFREGIQINKSLFTLRQVIAALYESSIGGKAAMSPPYRDSKLTSLLKQSIGGNSYCLMLACLSPISAHFQDSLQTLSYASMASCITSKPTRNVDPKVQQNVHLREQNSELQAQIGKLQEHIQKLTQRLEQTRCSNCQNPLNFQKEDNKHERKQSAKQIKDAKQIKTVNDKLFEKREQKLPLQSVAPFQLTVSHKKQDYMMRQRSFAAKSTKSVGKEAAQSIGIIKDLIDGNSSLRAKIEQLKSQVEKQERETYALMKENQVLRDRWEMVSGALQPINQIEEESPIATFERLLREQRGEGLKLGATNPHSCKADTEIGSKNSNKDFLRNRRIQQPYQRPAQRNQRIYSQAKKISHESFFI